MNVNEGMNLFENAAMKIKNSYIVFMVFILSLVMFIIGCNHFIEDTISSRFGLTFMESAFGLNVESFDFTYWTLSISPQVASIVFGYIAITNSKKRGFLWAALGFELLDTVSDIYYRSNGMPFTSFSTFIVSLVLTLVVFSIGSNVFITIGFGMSIELFASFVQQWRRFKFQISKAKKQPTIAGNEPKTAISTHRPMPQTSFRPKAYPTRPVPQDATTLMRNKLRQENLARSR